jgi:mono/diheme cytochrome c family protein
VPTNNNSGLWFGIGAVVVLIAAVIVMLIITSGDVSTTAAPASLSSDAQAGKTIFLSDAARCSSCHPSEGRAGGLGPRLSTINDTDDSIRRYIRSGTGAMPANSVLSDDQVNKLITYIHALKPA